MTNDGQLGRHLPALADELVTLTAILDQQRDGVITTASELTDAQGRSQPVAGSTMTAMGLIKHLAATERWWFSLDFAGRDVEPPWPDDDGEHDGFELDDTDTMAAVIEAYRSECAESRAVVTATRDLDQPARQPPGQPFNLRFALVHLIEETAQHHGHLDLLRDAARVAPA